MTAKTSKVTLWLLQAHLMEKELKKMDMPEAAQVVASLAQTDELNQKQLTKRLSVCYRLWTWVDYDLMTLWIRLPVR